MADKGKSDKIGVTTTEDMKDFKDSKVEGKKPASFMKEMTDAKEAPIDKEEERYPKEEIVESDPEMVTIETVLENRRGKKKPRKTEEEKK